MVIFNIKTDKDNGPYHDTLIKFNHDSNYHGDEFISFWQVIIIKLYRFMFTYFNYDFS
jgi:hypothetical protein